MSAVIPLWVEGRLVWVGGLSRRTTCRDVVRSVVRFQWGGGASRRAFRLVERWRRTERTLPSRCRILRLWQAWREERPHVLFLLRPARAGHLRRLLVAQQLALAQHARRLELRQAEIEQYETSAHLERVLRDGENYLQEACLGPPEAAALYERIHDMTARIEEQEARIRALSEQIRPAEDCIRAECLAALNETQRLAIEHNNRVLREYDRILAQKQSHVSRLEGDLSEADRFRPDCPPDCWECHGLPSLEDGHVVDSSSDTGLSSLTSSCDDSNYNGDKNCYVLDTLV